jgi:hypothetical protein
MGDQVPLFGFKWLSFVSGSLSQQHYAPFVQQKKWLDCIVNLSSLIWIACFVIGIGIFFKRKKTDCKARACVLIAYIILIVISFVHIYAARGSLYTQAKGSQNVIILMYIALCMPLLLALSNKSTISIDKLQVTLMCFLIVFCTMLLIPRVDFLIRLSRQQDRAGILESSFFRQAKKIKNEINPLVIYEPRKSADLYYYDQAFFGKRILPTRHLILKEIVMSTPISTKELNASTIVLKENINNLWKIESQKNINKNIFYESKYKWNAVKIDEQKTPFLIIFAHDYEKNIQARKLSNLEGNVSLSSYIRNGVVLLFTPKNIYGELAVTIEPRNPKDYSLLVQETKQHAAKGAFGDIKKITCEGIWIKIISNIKQTPTSALHQVSKFSGEYWVSAKLNGVQL